MPPPLVRERRFVFNILLQFELLAARQGARPSGGDQFSVMPIASQPEAARLRRPLQRMQLTAGG